MHYADYLSGDSDRGYPSLIGMLQYTILTVDVFAVTDFHYPDRKFFILNCLMDFKFRQFAGGQPEVHCYKESKSAIIVR